MEKRCNHRTWDPSLEHGFDKIKMQKFNANENE